MLLVATTEAQASNHGGGALLTFETQLVACNALAPFAAVSVAVVCYQAHLARESGSRRPLAAAARLSLFARAFPAAAAATEKKSHANDHSTPCMWNLHTTPSDTEAGKGFSSSHHLPPTQDIVPDCAS